MEAYSAGLMSQSFWFIEFQKVVKLISDGKSQNEIKSAPLFEKFSNFSAAAWARASGNDKCHGGSHGQNDANRFFHGIFSLVL